MPRPTASVPPVRFNVGGAAMPRPIHNRGSYSTLICLPDLRQRRGSLVTPDSPFSAARRMSDGSDGADESDGARGHLMPAFRQVVGNDVGRYAGTLHQASAGAHSTAGSQRTARS